MTSTSGSDGTTVLVTGATSGIGRSTALAFAARGASLRLTGRDPAALAEVGKHTGGATFQLDLGTPDGPDQLATWALRSGAPDVVVHAAGIGLSAPAADVAEADLDLLFTVNVRAPMLLTARLLPAMRSRGRGHLVFVTSIAGLLGVPDESVYAATKAALHAYARSLAGELAPDGILVSTVAPGVVDTRFFVRRGAPYARRFPRPLPAARVADAVVGAVEQRRSEVVVPRWLRIPVLVQSAAPTAYHRLAARATRR